MTRMLATGLALVLPIAGVLGMIVRSEVKLALGVELRVPIRGFDPRDLLRGHYLMFQFDWTVQGACAEGEECCYCLDARGPGARGAQVQQAACMDLKECPARMDAAELDALRRFYVPEEVGTRLEDLVRHKRAVAVLAVTPQGGVVLKQLEVDGKPWREVLESR